MSSKYLKNTDIDKLIEQKIECEIQQEIDDANKIKEITLIKDFSKVPRDKVFDNSATYKVFNRKTKKEAFINGPQAESLLGLNKSIRDDIENGYIDNFTMNEYYVRFHIYRCE
jgi:hypothetical protein